MRIEGEKGVKTQSAPKHWPRTRKREFWPSNSNLADRYGRAGKEACSAGFTLSRDKTVRAHARTGKERPRSADFVSERTDRAGRSGKQTLGLGRNLSPNKFGRPNRSTAKIHRPSAQTFLGQGKSPFHLIQTGFNQSKPT
ncbi:unnamed protein product [Microthlaspi erraticum]|uniref:Uncharacterized protein n=1 Tax=Microthlaspi erraticum TaxID=1685480 RepID=A0A6D2I3U4_9BRAS|nr:unnamed protein product [Microthlaspi erraticum]